MVLCQICSTNFTQQNNDAVLTECGHLFHPICLEKKLDGDISDPKCPKCNKIMISQQLSVAILEFDANENDLHIEKQKCYELTKRIEQLKGANARVAIANFEANSLKEQLTVAETKITKYACELKTIRDKIAATSKHSQDLTLKHKKLTEENHSLKEQLTVAVAEIKTLKDLNLENEKVLKEKHSSICDLMQEQLNEKAREIEVLRINSIQSQNEKPKDSVKKGVKRKMNDANPVDEIQAQKKRNEKSLINNDILDHLKIIMNKFRNNRGKSEEDKYKHIENCLGKFVEIDTSRRTSCSQKTRKFIKSKMLMDMNFSAKKQAQHVYRILNSLTWNEDKRNLEFEMKNPQNFHTELLEAIDFKRKNPCVYVIKCSNPRVVYTDLMVAYLECETVHYIKTEIHKVGKHLSFPESLKVVEERSGELGYILNECLMNSIEIVQNK